MATLNWLHLSDLHRGLTPQKWLWTNVESILFDDLNKLHDQCGPWSVMFFTGDLTQKGSSAEYEKLTETLRRLYAHLQKLGSNPILLAVPGNHDLQRPDEKAPAVKLLRKWRQDTDLQEEFWTKSTSLYRQQISESFANYEQWVATHPFPKPKVLTSGLLPGDFAASINQDGIDVGVVGLNVTFLQLTKGNYRQKLALSSRQISEVCGEHYDDWFKKHNANFLLTHQPPSWLDESSQSILNGEINIPGRFVAHLYGHMHEHASYAESSGGSIPRNSWQAPSIFGLETFGKNTKRQHGFTCGRLELSDASERKAKLWPRVAVKHQAGHFKIVADPSSTLDSSGALVIAVQGAIKKVPLAPSTKTSTFSILLLSTDNDLREAREAIALHLKQSLGVSVVSRSGNEEIDTSAFDHVVLIQGWWWNEGIVVQAWQEVKNTKRSAFVVGETSDWPPRRLTELSATDEVRQFRESLEGAFYFEDPKELPEKIGHTITILLKDKTGDARVGLRVWERAYMDFRLPAWRSGRTASPGHLLEAENTEELYQADLYITLDGVSGKWQRGPDGKPKRIPKRKKKTSSAIVSERSEPRVPLGRWLSIPDLPRIALVGAPGGGKTVFLTRTAAAIASACLGRPGELEPDIDLNCLRHQSGTLPIPVVLEATRIANRKSLDVSALIEAMSEEMAVAGEANPRAIEIRQGLRGGRYLLLIDALDEIAESAVRTSVLDLLKGLAAPGVFPKTRFVLTTRSARYTGSLKFGQDMEIVEVAPLSDAQVSQLCSNWTMHRGRDEAYLGLLRSAVDGLADQVSSSSTEDQALSENPLMLTAVCMVFERYRSLPDDRGRLCELLVDDLCRSRNSEDTERGWKLDDATKKDLLQRIALAMQELGAQSWPVSRALQIATTLVPRGDKFTQLRAKKYLDWAADHTGLLRFQQDPKGEEQIRFWHRLFREYLAAARLAQLDKTASDMIDQLWREKRLENPFWEDVVRLLPRPLGTFEKARSLRERLEELAANNPASRARLLGLTMAGIIENRDLYPDVDFAAKALELANVYESEAQDWEDKDKLLFLEGLGRLDPVAGDPRLHSERWLEVPQGRAKLGGHHHPLSPKAITETLDVADFDCAWAPVTVQEFQIFLQSSYVNEHFSSHHEKRLRDSIRKQLRHPNWPVVSVSLADGESYCKWRTAQRTDGRIVRLPWDVEVVRLASYIGETHVSLKRHHRGEQYPVGLVDKPSARIVDLWGGIYQWCTLYFPFSSRIRARGEDDPNIVFGIDPIGRFSYPPSGRDFWHDSIGLRCVLVSQDNAKLSRLANPSGRKK